MLKNLILILIFTIAFAGSFANAQIRSTDIVLSLSPEYPNPNQNVDAMLSSHSINLDKANISWSINNKTEIIGIGKKTFSFKASDNGIPTSLSVTIDTIDGQSISKKITITPASVDMLWEAYDVYSPPFYKGKTLVPSQGTFKVVAIPNLVNSQNQKINSNNLSYSWIKDGDPELNSSGWGKNYFIFKNSYLDRGNNAEVKVSDISGNTNASGKISLNTSTPKILFYKYDLQFGTKWETALSDGFTINSGGETLVVEPYFFSPKNLNSNILSLNWFLNGNSISTSSGKNVLSIKPEDGQSGNATIKVNIENTGTLFQSGSKQLQVNF